MGTWNKVTQEELASIVEMINSGKSYKSISEETGRSRECIRDIGYSIGVHKSAGRTVGSKNRTSSEKEALKKKVAEEYVNGLSRADICEKYGISKNSVTSWTKEVVGVENLPRHKFAADRQGMNEEEKEKIIAMFKEGRTPTEISKEIGRSIPTVSTFGQKMGVYTSTKKQPTYTTEFRAKIIDLVVGGSSVASIAKEHGVAEETIRTWCKNANVQISQHSKTFETVEEKESENMVKTNDIPSTSVASVDTMAESDYAKNYRNGDSRWKNCNLHISQTLKIDSGKTGYSYRINSGDDVLTIHTNDGRELTIPISDLSNFADELIDIYIEVSDFLKASKKSR